MAKKTSTNAVRKIDEQIKNLETMNKESKKAGKTSPTSKSNIPYAAKREIVTKNVRDDVVISPTKKVAPVKKAIAPSKNVRGSVLVPPAKKRTTTKTIQKESVKNEMKNIKKQEIRDDIIVPSEKKDLEAEVNKILGIEETTPPFVPLDLRDEVVIPKEAVIRPKKTTLKTLPKKEDAPVKEELETKIHEFLEKEDQKEISTPAHETNLDDIDVIKFETKKEVKKPYTSKKKGNLRKKPPVRKNTIKKPVPIEEFDKMEEFNIVEDIKKDLPSKTDISIKKEVPVKAPVKVDSKKNDFRRKRKGKGYVVDISKKPYKELESDLRSLYDRVNDVVDDFEGPRKDSSKVVGVKEPVKKSEKKKFNFNLKSLLPKKIPKKPTVVPTKPVKKPVVEPSRKVKVVKDVVVNEPDNRYKERPSILDHISQRVLNFFLIVLFTIFTLMVIAFIAFVIYVSTF